MRQVLPVAACAASNKPRIGEIPLPLHVADGLHPYGGFGIILRVRAKCTHMVRSARIVGGSRQATHACGVCGSSCPETTLAVISTSSKGRVGYCVEGRHVSNTPPHHCRERSVGRSARLLRRCGDNAPASCRCGSTKPHHHLYLNESDTSVAFAFFPNLLLKGRTQ